MIFQLFPFLQDIRHLKLPERPNSSKSDRINQRNLGDKVAGNKVVVEGELILFIECDFITMGPTLLIKKSFVQGLLSKVNMIM